MKFINHEFLKQDKVEQRLYQELLAERVIEKGSTLIVAPTALGKTVIAALVIAHRLREKPESKILFLAPTKPLAVQHLKSMKELINLPDECFAIFTGAIKPSDRREQWQSARIIIGTPQSFENDLLGQSISLSNVSLLIVDEAHRAVKGYSYVFLVEQYMKQSQHPLVLALTASPGSTREKIQEVCQNLHIKNVEVKTEHDADVVDYVHEKVVEWKRVKLPEQFMEIKDLLKRFMQEKLEELKELGFIDKYNTGGVSKVKLLLMQQHLLRQKDKDPSVFRGISIIAMLMKVNHATELLETQGIKQLKIFFEKLQNETTRASKTIMEDIKIRKALVKIEALGEIEHPKLALLVETVKEELKTSENIIIFSHYRNTASELEKLLEKEGIKCKRFVGQATKVKDKGLSQKQQTELLEQFKQGEFKVIIMTSVGEEGLDIPSVDCVIFYEPVPSEIRLIQRRGRTGRKKAGKIIILLTENTRDEAYYWSSIRKEKKMHSVLDEMKDTKIAEKQKTLEEYSEKSDAVIVFVDNRERASGITRELVRIGVEVKPKQLPVADFLLSDRVAVERKAANDFIDSMISGRLFSQAVELVNNFAKPIIIVEGDLFGIRNVHDNAINGAIASLIIDYGITVLQTRNIEESANLIKFMAKREQSEERRNVRLQGSKKTMPVKDQQQFIVESLPGVGPSLAMNLLKHFKTIKNIFNAGTPDLEVVEKLGDKKAKNITDIIEKEYEE